ncbi:MAG: hypothetical protein ABIE94_06980, partial [archaeon]
IIEGKEGVVLGGQPYGGIWNHTWLDRQVKLIGRVPVGDEIYEVEFDALIPERAIHSCHKDVDAMKVPDAFKHELFKAVMGYDSKQAFVAELRELGLSENDLQVGSWYFVPRTGPLLLAEKKIVSYGHDDRGPTFCGVTAGLASSIDTRTFPAIVYGCNREEIGSTGGDGALSPFIDMAVDTLLKLEGVPERDISAALQRRVYWNSVMFSGDVDIAITTSDEPYQDENYGAHMNRGVVVVKSNGSATQSMGHRASDMMARFTTDLLNDAGVMYQMAELPSKPQQGGGGTIARHFGERGIDTIDIGPPVGNMHGQEPYLHIGDLAMAEEADAALINRKK